MKDEKEKPTVEKEEKKLLCPFNPDPNFSCSQCRLYVRFSYGEGAKTCVFNRLI